MTRHTWVYRGVRKYAFADQYHGFRLVSAEEFHNLNKEA